jgi:hypothetical protein
MALIIPWIAFAISYAWLNGSLFEYPRALLEAKASYSKIYQLFICPICLGFHLCWILIVLFSILSTEPYIIIKPFLAKYDEKLSLIKEIICYIFEIFLAYGQYLLLWNLAEYFGSHSHTKR